MTGIEDVKKPPRAIVVDAKIVGEWFYVPIMRDLSMTRGPFNLFPKQIFEKATYHRSTVFPRMFLLAAITKS